MKFQNVYEDRKRADAYSKLEFPGTYYLAYRDIPAIVRAHVRGTRAVDFGCGAGRSTRFLRGLGFDVVGVDISEQMIAKARALDPRGDYRLVSDNNGSGDLPLRTHDLVLSMFTFDNIATMQTKVGLFEALKSLLKPAGRIISLVSTPEIYVNEWTSFSTKDFPTNRTAKSGDTVYTVMLDVQDRRPVADVLWTSEDYQRVYDQAGLRVVQTYLPLARSDEAFEWVSETTIAPWCIYVLEGEGAK
jgi:SAM-dependent methyltransferase